MGRTPAHVVVLLLAVGCSGESVPAAPGGSGGPFTGETPFGEDPMADRGYKASCATEEEPNGPQDDPDPYYSYRATEVVQTQLGQEVAVTRCGRYYRNAGNLVTTPEDDCTTEKRIVHAGEFTVLCHLLEDFREVPGYDDGQLEEVGWKEIYIKLSPRPTRARCDDSKEFESEDPRILSIYHEYDLVYWQAPEFLLVTQCDCFEDHGNGESPTPGCTTFSSRPLR